MNKPTNRWTKEELRLHNHSYLDLCKAVIKQWNADGKPSASRETIEAWSRLMMEFAEVEHKKE
jgi:hypothetical protein